MLAYIDASSQPRYVVFNNGGERVTDWTTDIVSVDKGWQTANSVYLTSSGNTVWSLFTGGGVAEVNPEPSLEFSGTSGYSYWKTVYVVP